MTASPVSSVPRRLSELLEDLGGPPAGPDVAVSALTLDSGRVKPGTLFLAVPGARDHGVRHVPEALRRGASAILWDPTAAPGPPSVPSDVPMVSVPGLGQRAGALAARFYGHPSSKLTVIGVTGTDGKTSVTHFLARALTATGLRCGLVGTLGSGFPGAMRDGLHTTPDAVSVQAQLARLAADGARAVAMEVSSHALDQGRVDAVEIAIAVLTHLGRDHLDYHGGPENYARAKRKLFAFPTLKAAVLNLDDPFGRAILSDLITLDQVWGYTARATEPSSIATVALQRAVVGARGLAFDLSTPRGEVSVETALLGRFNVANLSAVLAVMLILDVPLERVPQAFSELAAVPGRMECLGGGNQPLVVVDFAHTPGALEQVLRAARDHTRGTLWCVFGCGGNRDRGKRPLMGRAAEQWADRVVLTDDNPRTESPAQIVADVLSGVHRESDFTVVHDRREAIETTLAQARPGDTVLIAGKGHEQVQIVADGRRAFSDRNVVVNYLREVMHERL